jgi:hypothetical protein
MAARACLSISYSERTEALVRFHGHRLERDIHRFRIVIRAVRGSRAPGGNPGGIGAHHAEADRRGTIGGAADIRVLRPLRERGPGLVASSEHEHHRRELFD